MDAEAATESHPIEVVSWYQAAGWQNALRFTIHYHQECVLDAHTASDPYDAEGRSSLVKAVFICLQAKLYNIQLSEART